MNYDELVAEHGDRFMVEILETNEMDAEVTAVTANGVYGVETMEFPYSQQYLLDGFEKMRNGALVQVVFPEMSPDQREFLISGLTPEQWDNLVGAAEGNLG